MYDSDEYALGNYIKISKWGEVYVGNCYLNRGENCRRGTWYNIDGTI